MCLSDTSCNHACHQRIILLPLPIAMDRAGTGLLTGWPHQSVRALMAICPAARKPASSDEGTELSCTEDVPWQKPYER